MIIFKNRLVYYGGIVFGGILFWFIAVEKN